jgi:ATP-dependent protease HslVU (ClpYQ) peptidase subunit
MNFLKSLIAGFAGAMALNILHETMRKLDNEAPRLDLVGEQVVRKSAEALSIDPPRGNKLYGVTMAGDIITNATYFAAIGMGGKKYMPLRAIGAGVSAGFTALKAPKPLGLNEKHVANTEKRKVLTVAYYVFGALVTAGVLGLITKKEILK